MLAFVTFETSSMGITGKYVVASSIDAGSYSNTLTISTDSLSNVEFANKVASGGASFVSKIVCSITVAQSLFLDNGTAVCSMQISPVSNSCAVDIEHFVDPTVVTSSDPYILLTSTVRREFQIKIHGDINHYATPVTVVAT